MFAAPVGVDTVPLNQNKFAKPSIINILVITELDCSYQLNDKAHEETC